MVPAEAFEAIDTPCRELVLAREKGAIAHGIDHLWPVARFSELMGIAAGFSKREILLVRPAGWLHDFKRTEGESTSSSDEDASALIAEKLLVSLTENGKFPTTDEERMAVGNAIRLHSQPPDFFTEDANISQWTLRQRIQAALFAADKIDANGVWVIARRSMFVGGVRRVETDLKDVQPPLTAVTAVLAESAIRLAFINPQGMYPQVFKDVVGPLYEVQRDFVHGLMRSASINTQSIAKLLLNTKTPTGNNLLTTRKGVENASQNPEELAKQLRVLGGFDDQRMLAATGDLADSAQEAVLYFSSRYQEKAEALVQAWKPEDEAAKRWRQGMLDYASGAWFEQTRQRLLEAAVA